MYRCLKQNHRKNPQKNNLHTFYIYIYRQNRIYADL